jgi:AraC-like DNA-binding protein
MSQLAPILFLPAGQDRRLRRVTEHLRAHPDSEATLEDLAQWAGSSCRTIARLFLAETGMNFARWRDHLRIILAMDMLVRGCSITQAALDLGYQSQSGFTTMFTRIMGMPPGRFARQSAP